jgi:hypothetical protein
MHTNNSHIQAFWRLVSDNVQELCSLASEQAALSPEFLDALHAGLQAIDPCLTVFCTPVDDATTVHMVFGCDGYQQGIDQVLQLVAAAPPLEGVKPLAFSPRDSHIPDAIDLNGLLVQLEDVYFSLRRVQGNLHLDLYLEDINMHADDLRVEAVLMFLEAIIGEYDMMTCISSIDWHDLPVDPEDHGLKPLSDLRQNYDDLGPLNADYGTQLH